MNKQQIMQIALNQSAIDLGCSAEDFIRKENVIATSVADSRARRYLKLPFDCNMASYGTNIVASVKPEYQEIVRGYLEQTEVAHCFETPEIYILNEMLLPYNLKVHNMAYYFLPESDELPELACDYELRVLEHEDLKDLYLDEWSNALCEDRPELDVLGVGAYDNGRLIALAGCSADCEDMWQIGIDVLPEYRRQNIAAALTSRIAIETFKRGKIPFYCCAWCNIKSAKNATKCGFEPAWVEMGVK